MIFRLEYCNKFGDAVRVDITTPGLPTIVEVEGTGDPFRLKYTPDVNDKSFRFLTTSANINIYETPEFNIDTLKTSSETDIKVERYINGVRDWVGFVLPDFFSKEIRGNAVVSMVASDRISTLKGVTLSDLPDMLTIYDLATRCLDKTGLSLPLKTMCDFTNDVLSYNGVFRSYVMSYRLYDTKGRSISCYDVLQSILVLANSMLVQRNAEWYIVNKLQHEIGSGRVYSDESTYIPYQEVVKYFSEITKGAYQSIIPVAASVGIYHEHGGGRLYPNNYDFSQGLTGWTPKNGFVAEINNKEILGYYAPTPGVPVYEPDYGDVTDNNYLVNLKNNSPGFDPNWDTARYIESTILLPDGYSSSIEISVDINAISMRSNLLRYVVLAKKGSKILALNTAGSFETYSPTNDSHAQRLTFKTGEVGTGWTGSKIVKGVLDDADLSGYEIYIRVYGSGTGVTSFVNYLSVSFKNTAEIPKGTVYKREQTGSYTKSHDTDTTIFGDYGVGPVNGYVYEYPIDDTSSLLRNDAGELQPATWIDPTDTNSEEFPLLRHIVRQKARMFSVAHDLIRGEIEMVNFDPLAIFVDCSGKRYSLVSAEVDFLNSNVNLEIEEIAYKNLTVRDFIYSYFGEGESNIKSVGGIASGSGGGAGGGLTPEQLEILSFWKKDPDNPNTIFTEMNAYSKLELSAYGVGDGEGGGGGSDYERLDTWASYDSSKSGWVLSALLGNDLNTRVTDIDGRVTDLENSAGSGSVTSVGISVPTGLSVSNSPITSSGVIAISLQSGYSIPTTAKQANWDTAFTNTHTHSNKAVLDGITSGLVTNWNTAYTNSHTHSNKAVLDGITSGLVTNWNTAFTNTHTHGNKAVIDQLTQANINVLAKLSIVNGNLQIDGNAYSTGELSAYGVGSGGGSGDGIIETVYGYGDLGQTFDNSVLTDTFNAYTTNQLHLRLSDVETGSATNVTTTGTGNAITSISKTGTLITAIKGLTFSQVGHTHSWADITNKPSTFAPSAHTHPIAQVTGLQTALDGKQPLDADLTSIAGLSGTSGLLRKTAANTWSLDTNTYLTGNQTITLTGNVTGSGTTSITTSIAAPVVTGKALTGYTVGTNTALTATDTILSAFGKVQAQINARGGTVTSVAMTTPTGLTVSGSPITSSGTLALGLQSGYSIPTTAKQTAWDKVVTDFDDLEIGGRNLLRNSDFSSGMDGWSSNSDAEEAIEDGKSGVKITTGQGIYRFPTTLEEGATYTVSFLAKGLEDNSAVRIGFINQSGMDVTQSVDGTIRRYSATFTGTVDMSRNTFLHVYRSTGTIFITDIKLEKGNKPTDWTPAPEDVQAEIDLKAPIASPTFTGTVTAPTLVGTNANFSNQVTVGSSLITSPKIDNWDEVRNWWQSVGQYLKRDATNQALYTDENFYSTKEVSAYGVGSGGGSGGGIIETVYDYSKLGQSFNNATLTDTFNAYTINQINTRLTSVENGSATTVNTTGTGNAITSISKAGSVITANKGLTFLGTSIFNTHNNDNVRHITGAERTKWDGVVTDFAGLEIGGRNLATKTDLLANIGDYTSSGTDEFGDYIQFRTANSFQQKLNVKYEANTQYTLSTKLLVVSGSDLYIRWVYTDGTYTQIIANPQTEPELIVLTSTIGKSVDYFTYSWSNIGQRKLYEFKIEKGNKPTDWTPAPEDQVSDWNTTDVNSFSFIKNKPTLLSQFTDNIGVATHIANTSNPHSVTKTQVGLGNVDNTSDLLKPISTATQTALNLKANLASPTFTGTIGVNFPSSGAYNFAIQALAPTLGANQQMILQLGKSGTTNDRVSWIYEHIADGSVNNNTSFSFYGSTVPQLKIKASGVSKFSGTVTAPTFIGALTGNAASATALQTARTIWGQSFNGGANVSGAMTGVTTLAMTGALSGATTIEASTSVATPKVIFNAVGWSMEQVGSELQMKHNNVLKMRFTSTGSIVATEEITAFG